MSQLGVPDRLFLDFQGAVAGRYSLERELGRGGMGVVYKGEDLQLLRPVALKFLPHNLAANDTEKARFLQEARAIATMNHPNACTIYDIEEEDGQQFIIMEYIDGKTLSAAEAQRLSLDAVVA